ASVGATAPAAVAAVAAPTARALLARTGFVHRQATAAEVLVVEAGQRFARSGVVGHLDEAEAARVAGELVADDGGGRDRAVGLEGFSQFRIGGRVRQVANVDVHREPWVVCS